MSYTLVFTAEAHDGLRQLDPVVQESILDIIYDIAMHPLVVRRLSVRGVTVHYIDFEVAGVPHSAFVVLEVSHARHESPCFGLDTSRRSIEW
jgi:hypothetical protein